MTYPSADFDPAEETAEVLADPEAMAALAARDEEPAVDGLAAIRALVDDRIRRERGGE